MLRQAGLGAEVRAEMSGHSIAAAMKYRRQAENREKKRAAEALEEIVTAFFRFCIAKPMISLYSIGREL
jgi:hypothetical protein